MFYLCPVLIVIILRVLLYTTNDFQTLRVAVIYNIIWLNPSNYITVRTDIRIDNWDNMKPRGLCNEVWRRLEPPPGVTPHTVNPELQAVALTSNRSMSHSPMRDTIRKWWGKGRDTRRSAGPACWRAVTSHFFPSCSPSTFSFHFLLRVTQRLSVSVDPKRERSSDGHSDRTFTGITPTLARCFCWGQWRRGGEGEKEEKKKKKFEARWEIFKFDSVRADCRGGATSVWHH